MAQEANSRKGKLGGLFDDLSIAQVVAGALAAVTSMLLASQIGIYGSAIGVGVGPLLLGIVQPLWGYRGLFEAMSLVAIVALAAYLLVSRKKGTMRRKLEEAEKR